MYNKDIKGDIKVMLHFLYQKGYRNAQHDGTYHVSPIWSAEELGMYRKGYQDGRRGMTDAVFIQATSPRPFPETGWLVMNGRLTVAVPKSKGRDAADKVMQSVSPYLLEEEWLVLCEWSHMYYITTKEWISDLETVRKYTAATGRESTYNLATKTQELIYEQ